MMLGGVICGYSATGRWTAATAPPSAMTIDSTEAKIGRSMKKCENTTGLRSPLLGVGRFFRGPRLPGGQQLDQVGLGPRGQVAFGLRPGLDPGVRLHALHAGDDHALARSHALLDDPPALEGLAELYLAV